MLEKELEDKVRVKFISKITETELEKAITKFLDDHNDISIIEIQYRVACSETRKIHSAMVAYKNFKMVEKEVKEVQNINVQQ